jgi:tight adherence protein C
MAISTAQQRRARRLRFELPVVADAIALHVVAGESVASAIDQFVGSSGGVASEELERAMDLHRRGSDLTSTLTEISKTTADSEATRLYALLGQAHTTGGRLSSSLTELAADYRAALARDLTAEGGKRAIAGYGPVLVLMVPVALLFLLYPTLVGLRQLAGGP